MHFSLFLLAFLHLHLHLLSSQVVIYMTTCEHREMLVSRPTWPQGMASNGPASFVGTALLWLVSLLLAAMVIGYTLEAATQASTETRSCNAGTAKYHLLGRVHNSLTRHFYCQQNPSLMTEAWGCRSWCIHNTVRMQHTSSSCAVQVDALTPSMRVFAFNIYRPN